MHHSSDHECENIDDKIIKVVNDVGWFVILIEATDYLPSFAYTIGLWKNYKHPELIAFGMSVKTLHAILNIAGEEIKSGRTYQTGFPYDEFFKSVDSRFVAIDQSNLKHYFGYAIWYNDSSDFPAMQLVWADRNNIFPWGDTYQEEFKYRQPLLDRNAAFKFREAKNLGIFTTRQWLEEKKPVLRVVHDEDGDWQFLTGDQMPEDIKLVCLEHIINSDLSLNDVFDLDYGEQADRSHVGGKWERSKCEAADEEE